MTGRDGFEDLRMREEHALGAAGRLVTIEDEFGAVVDEHAAAMELAEAKLGSLQIAQNANGMARAFGDGAYGLDVGLGHLVRGVAHIDAKDVDAGVDEFFNHLGR